jgi:hypothetical protein
LEKQISSQNKQHAEDEEMEQITQQMMFGHGAGGRGGWKWIVLWMF